MSKLEKSYRYCRYLMSEAKKLEDKGAIDRLEAILLEMNEENRTYADNRLASIAEYLDMGISLSMNEKLLT